jgi:GNAT superfamily N-acetyltransferase
MGVITVNETVEKAVDFIMAHSTYKNRDNLLERVQQHYDYKTCKILMDTGSGIFAVVLWDISPDQEVCTIRDLVIREDHRNQGLMKQFLKEGLKIWPVKYLEWNRDYNEDGSDRWPKNKRFKVSSLLRRKI